MRHSVFGPARHTSGVTTVSAGPYALTIGASPTASRISANASRDSASPPTVQRRTRSVRPCSLAQRATSTRYAGGISNHVTRWASISATIRSAPHSSGPVRISVAPCISGASHCSTAASKLIDAKWSARSSDVSPYATAIAWPCVVRLPCGTATPLGAPVEPDV